MHQSQRFVHNALSLSLSLSLSTESLHCSAALSRMHPGWRSQFEAFLVGRILKCLPCWIFSWLQANPAAYSGYQAEGNWRCKYIVPYIVAYIVPYTVPYTVRFEYRTEHHTELCRDVMKICKAVGWSLQVSKSPRLCWWLRIWSCAPLKKCQSSARCIHSLVGCTGCVQCRETVERCWKDAGDTLEIRWSIPGALSLVTLKGM